MIFWYFPLSFLDSIYTKYQDPKYMDQNFYAYHAKRLCQTDNLTIEDFCNLSEVYEKLKII